MTNVSYLFLELNAVHACFAKVSTPIDALNRFTQLRHSKVKYKFISYKESSPPSPWSLPKLIRFKKKTRMILFNILESEEPHEDLESII